MLKIKTDMKNLKKISNLEVLKKYLQTEFDNWEAITSKTYPALKTFIAVQYTRRILAQQLCNTAG